MVVVVPASGCICVCVFAEAGFRGQDDRVHEKASSWLQKLLVAFQNCSSRHSSVTGTEQLLVCYSESSEVQCNWQGTLQVCCVQVTGFSNDNVAFSYGAKRHSKKHGKIGKKHCKPAISISFFQVEARLCASCSSSSETVAPMRMPISSKCLHCSSMFRLLCPLGLGVWVYLMWAAEHVLKRRPFVVASNLYVQTDFISGTKIKHKRRVPITSVLFNFKPF